MVVVIVDVGSSLLGPGRLVALANCVALLARAAIIV